MPPRELPTISGPVALPAAHSSHCSPDRAVNSRLPAWSRPVGPARAGGRSVGQLQQECPKEPSLPPPETPPVVDAITHCTRTVACRLPMPTPQRIVVPAVAEPLGVSRPSVVLILRTAVRLRTRRGKRTQDSGPPNQRPQSLIPRWVRYRRLHPRTCRWPTCAAWRRCGCGAQTCHARQLCSAPSLVLYPSSA